jgi:hypothetical protein
MVSSDAFVSVRMVNSTGCCLVGDLSLLRIGLAPRIVERDSSALLLVSVSCKIVVRALSSEIALKLLHSRVR